jgi:DNA polymerase elongation subunit (family B)
MDFPENQVLFGRDPAARILCVELSGDRQMEVFRRATEDGSVAVEAEPFEPFLWLAGTQLGLDSEPLEGGLPYDHLARFAGWAEFSKARARLRDAKAAHFAFSDPVQQYLTASGRTLFKGMEFTSLRRLQLAVETDGEAVRAIAVSDCTGWEELITSGESDALERLNEIVQERDPDVIEGHDLFRSGLPLLAARARHHRLKLTWGRDGSPVTSRASRVQIAERTINYPRFSIRGRHVADTYLLVQFYDIGTRELESFDLKEVARHFGIPPGDGARTVRALSDLLSRSYFIQAQIFPYNYQDIIVRGNATRIDALFLREYYHRRHSLPELPEARAFEGGYTDIFFTGVAKDVHHCDVASLYPSVMLRYGLFPANDKLEIFRGLLSDLRLFRLEAKAAMRAAAGARDQQSWNALQNVFKILINSFYGYLGFSQGHFADYDAAARVTEKGRELLKQMVAWLTDNGARVIEIDTDGVYFVPPSGRSAEELRRGLGAALPDGIDIEFDAKYRAMFSYKAKNYALLDDAGEMTLKGGALKSRGLEKFQRVYLERMIRLLLEDRRAEVPALRMEFERAIRERQWPIEMLLRTDTLQDSLSQYHKKVEASARNRSAPYELASRSGRAYQPGDQIRYYIAGKRKQVSSYESAKLASEWQPSARDENVEYYVAKLDELARKYEEFTGSLAASAQGELF